MVNVNKTKVITGTNTRLSYFHGWEPVSINGGTEKYSVSVLIPKSDTNTIVAIEKAIDAAIEEGVAKFGGRSQTKQPSSSHCVMGTSNVMTRLTKGTTSSMPIQQPHHRLWIKPFNRFLTVHKCTVVAMGVCPSTFMPLTRMGIRA